MYEIRLLTSDHCPLCDKAEWIVNRVAADHPVELEVVDIASDPERYGRYQERLPVVFVDGSEVFAGKVSEWRLRRHLRETDEGD